MFENDDFQKLQDHFDERYKRKDDCAVEMKEVRDENTSVKVDIAAIKETQNTILWLCKTVLAAVLTAIVGAVILVITNGG